MCIIFIYILNKELWNAWGLGKELTPHHKKTACYEMLHRALELACSREHGNEPLGPTNGREFLD
jgi:hypothetical protein